MTKTCLNKSQHQSLCGYPVAWNEVNEPINTCIRGTFIASFATFGKWFELGIFFFFGGGITDYCGCRRMRLRFKVNLLNFTISDTLVLHFNLNYLSSIWNEKITPTNRSLDQKMNKSFLWIRSFEDEHIYICNQHKLANLAMYTDLSCNINSPIIFHNRRWARVICSNAFDSQKSNHIIPSELDWSTTKGVRFSTCM